MLTPYGEQLWLSMLMSACAGFLAVNVVLGALWMIRRQRLVTGACMPGAAGKVACQWPSIQVMGCHSLLRPLTARCQLPAAGCLLSRCVFLLRLHSWSRPWPRYWPGVPAWVLEVHWKHNPSLASQCLQAVAGHLATAACSARAWQQRKLGRCQLSSTRPRLVGLPPSGAAVRRASRSNSRQGRAPKVSQQLDVQAGRQTGWLAFWFIAGITVYCDASSLHVFMSLAA